MRPSPAQAPACCRSRRPTNFQPTSCGYNQRCKPRRIALGVGATLAALALVCALLFASPADASGTVYLTPSGRCYHKADCMFVEGKDNLTALSPQQAEAAGYEPCSWCIGRSDS